MRVVKIIFLMTTIFIMSCGGGETGGNDPQPDIVSPSVPESITAVASSPTEINVSWNASSDNVAVAGYKVFRDGNLIADQIAIAYIDSGLMPDTQYCYAVSSYDAAGNESAQGSLSCTTTPEPPDTTAPTIDSTNPVDAATGVDYNVVITVTFSEPMLTSSITDASFLIVDGDSNPVSGVVTYNEVTNTASFTPAELLDYEKEYTVTMTTAVKDLAENNMSSEFSWSFTSKEPQVSFASGGIYSIGSQTTDMIAKDFNNDTNLDLAVSYYSSSTVSILPGDGTGQLGARIDYSAGDKIRAITTGYFNSDTNIDIAVANELGVFDPPGTVSVLMGDGAGAFDAPVAYAVGTRPLDIATNDFDGDSIPDLVVPNWNDNTISILSGSANGNFSAAVNYSASSYPLSVAYGDLNNDSILDIVVAGSGNVSILPGLSNGSFGPASSFSTGGGARSVATADMDNDGNLDVIAGTERTYVSILYGNGLGALSAPVTANAGYYTDQVYVTDFNSDGINDIAVTSFRNGGAGSNTVYVILGYGDRRFGTANAIYTLFSLGIDTPEIAIGDYNKDGKPDIVTEYATYNENNKVYILLNATE